MKNSKFKVKPLFVLAVTALILLVTAISTVTYAWIETGNNLVIQTADATNNAANISVVNRAGYARNMAKNKQDSVINLNEYVDYRNLYFAPATGKMVDSNGNVTQEVDQATDVKVSINGENPRDVLPEDISTNYIDFEIKVKNNENTHSDIKFANSDTDRVLVIDGVDVSKAKFGVAVIATNTNDEKKVIFTDSDKLRTDTPSFGTLYPHEELTLRVKIWLESDYSKFTSKDTVIAGKPVTLNLSLVMTDPKTTTFKFADRTTDFDDFALLKLGQAGGYKLFAVNGGNPDERYQLTAESTNADGVTILSGMPEFLLYGSCAEKHNPPFKDDFQLWAYEDGDLTKDPKVWIPGFKLTGNGYTDTYTIYGDLALRIDPEKAEKYLRGTWEKVVEVELRDQSVEKVFTDESINMVTIYDSTISYPMYLNLQQNSATGEMEPTNVLTTYARESFLKKTGYIYFDSRTTVLPEGTDNLLGTVKAQNIYTDGKVENQDKYVFTVFGLTGETMRFDDGTKKQDYCFGEWYDGDVDKVKIQDATTVRIMLQRYKNSDGIDVTYKSSFNGDGLDRKYYKAYYDQEEKCWYTVLPSDVKDNIKFRFHDYWDGGDELKEFDGANRTQTNGEYIYSFTKLAEKKGSWTYNLADDTVIYVKYDATDVTQGHSGLFVMQDNPTAYYQPLGGWDPVDGKHNNKDSNIIEDGYKVFYINRDDFDLGTDGVLYGERFHMRPFIINNNNEKDSLYPGNITGTTDKKPLYVGGRYRIEADKTVIELASFGYIRSEQTVIADVNEICSLQGAVDFQDPGTNITYSLQLNVTEGTGAASENVTQLSISKDAADYGRLTFQANKAGEYKVKVTAKANEGTTEKTSEKTFIFKVGLNPRITIADNVNVNMAFSYTDHNGIERKLINGSSAKIMQGIVLKGNTPSVTNSKFNLLEFSRYKAVDPDNPATELSPSVDSSNKTYEVGNTAALIDAEFTQKTNNYKIVGNETWRSEDGNTVFDSGWNQHVNMEYDQQRNVVYATIVRTSSTEIAKIKILNGDNTSVNRENGNYCVNYNNPKIKIYVDDVQAKIVDDKWRDLTITGLKEKDAIKVEYDCTNNIISIKKALASIDVKLFAVPEFDKAQVSVTAKGQDAAIIKAGKNDGTGTAYEGTTVTMEQIVSNADFNRYSVKYFTVEFKNAAGGHVGEYITVHPGDTFTMPAKTDDVALVEITTHINKDETPFYVAGSADNINWQLPTKAMTVTDNTVTGYVTIDEIGENGECFIRIAKGSSEETAFKQVNTSVTMSKAGRPNVYVESDSNFPATHEQQSIKIIKPGIFKQTFKVTYDLGNHRMTISAPLYFQSTLETMSVTTNVTTNIVIGALLPNSSNAKYTTVCSDIDATIGKEDTATPTFTSSNEIKNYKVVTTAEVTINGEQCFASKTFDVDVNDLVDVTIKKHDQFAISGVKVTATHTPTGGVQSEYTPSANDVTFRAAVGETVTLTLDIPNDKFNGFYADKDNNFTITDGSKNAVNKNFTTNYTVATFIVPAGGATVTPTPAQHNSMTYYLTGDSNAVDGVSWADTDNYNKTFTYDSVTDENGNTTYLNTITFKNVVLKGNKIANIKISRGGYKSGTNTGGRDDKKTSVSYTENMKFDWTGAPLSVTKVSVTSDEFWDIRIEGVFNANNPKKVNLKYYLAEHKLVITDSEDTGTVMTEDLLAVLRKQKVMFYFGINQDKTSGYLNADGGNIQYHYSFLNSMTYDTVSYNYAPVCLPNNVAYNISDRTYSEWNGLSMGTPEAGNAYMLKIEYDKDKVNPIPSASGCTVPNTSFEVNLTNQPSIDTGVTLNSSTSVTGAPNSLTYYITETPTTGNTYPTIATSTFKPFDPSNLKQLSEGNYIVVPVVSDGSILVRGADINLKITNKTIVDVDVTVEDNAHVKVTANSGATTINEGETQTLHADDEVTINAPIENATFNSYTRVQNFEIINAETKVVIQTVPATNNSATFTVPDVPMVGASNGKLIIKANLIQSDTVKYYITGENIDGISYWTSTDSDNMLFAFDKENNLFTKEIKLTDNTVQFKIAKNSSSLRDDPRYSISEADPRPTFTSTVNGLTAGYATSEYDGKTVYNFQLRGDAISGTTVKLTYNPSANTLIVSAPSNTKPKRTVKITPVDHAVVTATYTDASGNTVTIEEGAVGAQVYEGTELTLNCAILNPDFNSYNFAKYEVTGADLSGSKLTVGTSDITVKTNLSRDTTSKAAKFYLTGTGIMADGKTLNWDTNYQVMNYDTGANTVSKTVTLTQSGAHFKISKGDYVGGTDKKGRDNEDYSVTIAKNGRNDVQVTLTKEAQTIIDGTELLKSSSGKDIDRCVHLTYKTGVENTQSFNVKITYDLDKHEIIIDKVAEPTTEYRLQQSTNGTSWSNTGVSGTAGTVSGTVTLTGSAASETLKYFRIAKVDNGSETYPTLTLGDVHDYSIKESGSVKVTLPAGLTKQQLKFTYDIATNEVTVEAPVKFSNLTDVNKTATVNNAVTLNSTATATSGTPTYVTACTSTNSSTASINSTTPATPKFTATAADTYTVTTTAKATVGGVEYQAVKTYTITVSSVSTKKVTVLANNYAVVTATPAGGAAIAEGKNADVSAGTTITLNATLPTLKCKDIFNPYSFTNFVVKSGDTILETVTTNSGEYTVTGTETGDITIEANVAVNNPNIYLCGNKNIDGLSGSGEWITPIPMEWTKENPTVVSKEITLNTSGAEFKLVKDADINIGNKDIEDKLVDRSSNQIGNFLSGYTLSYTGDPQYNNFKLEGSPKKLLLTYDLATDKVSISNTTVDVTIKKPDHFDKSGMTVTASYGSSDTLTTMSENANRGDIKFGTTLTLTANIPNADFNSYQLTGFTVKEKNGDTIVNTPTVSFADGVGRYTLPASGVTAVEIEAITSQSAPELKLAHRAETTVNWTVPTENLAFDSANNKATGTFNVTTASDKYFTISNADATKIITLSSTTDVIGNSTYAAYEDAGKSVMVTLPAGLTEQTLKFTYTPANGKIAVDAPVKFESTFDDSQTAVVNTETSIQVSATGATGYSVACTNKTVGAADYPTTLEINDSGNLKFNAPTAGTYTVVVTAKDANNNVATKTYHVTVNAAQVSTVFKKGTILYFDFSGTNIKQANILTGTYNSTSNQYHQNISGVVAIELQSDLDVSQYTGRLVRAPFGGTWSDLNNNTSKLPTSSDQNCIKILSSTDYEWTRHNPSSETTKKTIYLKNTANWSPLNVYIWDTNNGNNSDFTGSFPGKSITDLGGTLVSGSGSTALYKLEVPNNYNKVIFTNKYKGTDQSDNLDLNDGYVYDNSAKTWTVYSAG